MTQRGESPNGPVGRGGKSLWLLNFPMVREIWTKAENGLEMDRNDTSSLLICLFVHSLGVQPSNGSGFLNLLDLLIVA